MREFYPTGKALQLLLALWLGVLMTFFALRWDMIYLTLPVIWLFFIAVAFFKPKLKVKIERILPHDRILEGEIIEVKLVVKSNERIPSLKITENVPEGLEVVEGSKEFLLSLKRDEVRELSYKIKVRRGVHEFSKIKMSYQDPFGFFKKDRQLELYDELIGVPLIEDVITPYSTKGTKITVGPLPSPRIGEGVEFHAIREYQPGDPFKVINWKATAKIGKIMSNEYESERKVDVVIVLDAGYLGANVIDYSVRAAASLMLDCLKNGTSFGLLLSESVPLWARVDYGKRHFFKCVDVLSTAKPDKNNLIAYQVEHLIRTRFPANAQIIYVSPLVSEESRKALKMMYHYGYKTIVISPDPYSALKPKSKEEDLAIKILDLRRKAYLRKLSSYALIIDWDITKPLKTAIAEVVRL